MRLVAAVLLITVACSRPVPVVDRPTPSPEPGVLEVAALLDLSGPRAGLGAMQRTAMEAWLERRRQLEEARPEVRVSFVDLSGSEARLFVELHRLSEEADIDAVLVGMPVPYSETLGRAIGLLARPVLFTLPLDIAEPAAHPGGRWAFALAPPMSSAAAAAVEDAALRGVIASSLVLRAPGPEPDPRARALEQEMVRRGRGPFTQIVLPSDGSVPASVRSTLPGLRSVHCTAPLPSCAAVARAASESQAPTFFYLPYSTVPTELEEALAERAVWPATAPIAQQAGATADDALTLLTAAANGEGADNAETARAALERINMPLIASTYAFGPDRHSGADPNDLAMMRWTGGTVRFAQPPAFGTDIPTPAPTP